MDFKYIIDSEESLLDAMRAVLSSRDGSRATGCFAAFGIEVREATADEVARDVTPNLSPRLNRMVKSVWTIRPAAQMARFEARCASRGIGTDGIRLLWHGSRNENWCSIIQRSLMLNPDAVRTGFMFGNGLYFSMEGYRGRGEKSFNYTSYSGSYWANGTSDSGFMGLYECAYGTPRFAKRTGWFTQADMDRYGTDCVHAEASAGFLNNDEVVFYDEDAVCLKYLVEFALRLPGFPGKGLQQ